MTKLETMSIFNHHIYEYKKGLRNLILHTVSCDLVEELERKLQDEGISYIVCRMNTKRANIFFGNEACIKVLERFTNKALNQFTDEEDFMLGILLGYDQIQQCRRYLKRRGYGKTCDRFNDLSLRENGALVQI
jgi:hypothetical protein